MDPILYNAAMEGNTGGAGDFILDDYLKRDEENGYQVTPKGNTVLHVAAQYGQSSFVQQVIDITPALLCRKNNKNETALHIAANKGHKDVVKVLLLGVVVVVAGGEGFNKETFMRMTDDNGDTALHKAVRSRHVDVVKILVKEDPEFEYPTNNAEETPLYLAAESGSLNCLMEILASCNRPTYAGPCGRTALHAAVIQKHRDSKDYAHDLIDEADNDGNTPLHLLAASNRLYVPVKLSVNPSATKMLFNKENKTPLDIVVSGTETTQMEKRSFKRSLRHCRLGKRGFEIKRKKTQETEDEMEPKENKPKRDKKSKLEDIMAATQIHLVVATLLVTVTFAAGFTLPGGFESDLNSPNKGMAILIRRTAFRAFVVSDAIAFTCSAGAVFSYFFIALNAAATKKIKIIRPLFAIASLLQLFAMSAVVLAFGTGMYATLAHSVGLAATVCVISCASFLVFTLLLCAFK